MDKFQKTAEYFGSKLFTHFIMSVIEKLVPWASFVVLSKLSLLGAGVLDYCLSSLRHGMLGQFSGEEQTDSGLDLSGGDCAPSVVMCNLLASVNCL